MLNNNTLKKIFLAYLIFSLLVNCKKDSNQTSSISFQEGDGVFDIEGNFYPSVIIGNGQEWTTINFRTTKYSDGSLINNVLSDVSWANSNLGSWCNYNNDLINDELYGKLYNYHALVGDTIPVERYIRNDQNIILDTLYYDSFPCKICPVGWKIPYEEDLLDLINYLGNANTAGGKMKDTSLLYWKIPNLNATNESGFSGLPGGLRTSDGSFQYIKEMGRWWCFEDAYQDYAHTRPLHYDQESTMNHYVFKKKGGLSLRLLKIN